VGDLAQRQLAEPRQVRRREKVLHRLGDALRRVDLAGKQALAQVLGR
jgi:hypothetical protein